MKPDSNPSDTLEGLRRALLDHYDRTARDLPWRRDTDPYRVLVSEMMLQQTRVETVMRYYEPWLRRFPSVEALAVAHEDEVLKAWEGLGYYRRARNLHRAAQVVAESHGGVIPSDPGELRALPGVGEYTTGAVASIAFGRPEPAVDGNVRRVLSRLFDEPDPKPAWLRSQATLLVSQDRPGDWTQALMELGATLCSPRQPQCARCPLSGYCRAFSEGTVAERPGTTARKAVPQRTFRVVLLHASGQVLVQRRPDTGLLAGMWAFPEYMLDHDAGIEAEAREPDGSTQEKRDARHCARAHGLRPIGTPVRLPVVKHRFTHLAARYVPLALGVDPVDVKQTEGRADVRWIGQGGRADTALPVAQRKMFESWIETLGAKGP